MTNRRQFMAAATGAAALAGSQAQAQPGAVRTLGAHEYSIDAAGNLRLNPVFIGRVVSRAVTDAYLYLSVTGPYADSPEIIRWDYGPASLPEVIHGQWREQQEPWGLDRSESGRRVIAVSSDGCVAVLG
jgi:hypothetical protein